MAQLALYREWRPQTFDDVVSQQHVVFPLRQAVISGDVGHAYLFSGTRGTGKTSLAKIFAKAVNCLQPENGNPCNVCDICQSMDSGSLLDVQEVDAASNNSVDNIRRITDEVLFTPVAAKYKVYIIDEVHMLSSGAFNALLKTLEEPPAHVIFILATTEPHRIPATIISRCQGYEFRRIPRNDIVGRLATIANEHRIDIADDALGTFADLADGALRDAISLLDQMRTGEDGPISREHVLATVGLVQDAFLIDMADALLARDLDHIFRGVAELMQSGRDLARFVTEMAQHMRNLLVCRVSKAPENLIHTDEASLDQMKELAGQTSEKILLHWISGLSLLLGELRFATNERTVLEINLLRLAETTPKFGPEFKPVPKFEPELKLEPKPEPKPVPEPKPRPEPKPSPEPKPRPEPKPESVHAVSLSEQSEQPERIPDPTPPPLGLYFPEPPVPEMEDASLPEPSESSAQASESPARSDDLPSSAHSVRSADVDSPAYSDKSADSGETCSQMTTKSADQEADEKTWAATLLGLRQHGRLDLNLLARSGHVKRNDTTWILSFDASQKVHYDEISADAAYYLLVQCLREQAGDDADLKVQYEDGQTPHHMDGFSAEPEWIQKLRRAAAKHDVPLEVEEE